MTHVDLFSGIGGFALAAQRAGFRTVCFSEVDEYASAVLRKHWPDVPNLGDIKSADFVRFRGATLLTGGFPCQPFSVAGQQAGEADDRYLWPSMLNAIQTIQPTWVVGENVTGLITLALDRVLTDLASAGYTAVPIVIPACAVDAKHRRDRVWIVANALRGGAGEGSEELPEAQISSQVDERRRGWPESGDGSQIVADPNSKRESQCARSFSEKRNGIGNSGEALADSDSVGQSSQRDRPFNPTQNSTRQADRPGSRGEVLPNTDDSRRQQQRRSKSGKQKHAATEQCCGWEPEPGVGRVAHGIPNRPHRIKALGNAIVPQVAFEILQVIAAIERGELK